MKYTLSGTAPKVPAWHAASNDPQEVGQRACRVGCRDACSRREGGAGNERSEQDQVERARVHGVPLEARLPTHGGNAGPRRCGCRPCGMRRKHRQLVCLDGHQRGCWRHPRDFAALLAQVPRPHSLHGHLRVPDHQLRVRHARRLQHGPLPDRAGACDRLDDQRRRPYLHLQPAQRRQVPEGPVPGRPCRHRRGHQVLPRALRQAVLDEPSCDARPR